MKKFQKNFVLKIALAKLFPTQYRAAHALDCDDTKLSMILNGRREPTEQELKNFRKILGPKQFREAFPDHAAKV